MRRLMLGNEALARGAWEAGVFAVSSYPGTPSTEITEYCAKYPEIYAEWAANEKVALEVSAGIALGGARALCCMKHVGLNVAADPLYTVAYTGVNGALVLVVADDPGMHSSQNEQDTRFHARSAQVPLLEPSNSPECAAFVKLACEISEKYDTPVIIRTTTRVAHARGMVEMGERENIAPKPYKTDVMKNVMMPGMARARHVVVEARMKRLAEDGCAFPENKIEMRDPAIGVIASGMAYNYAREALPEASTLKLALVNPLPMALIREFAGKVEKLYVFEELEPVIEEQLKAAGIACEGKNITGRQGELSARKLREALGLAVPEFDAAPALPGRPPVMCPGCPHRGAYDVIKKLKLTAFGDIGCYTLGALAPLSAIDASLCMGASIGMLQGFERALNRRDAVAVIGDSTFIHSGITSLISAVYNNNNIAVMILDNTTTGMTGHQPNPATGFGIHGEPATRLSLEKLCEACGAKVRVADPFEPKELEAALKEAVYEDGVSVVVCRRPCALLDKKSKKAPIQVDADKCRGCFSCMKLGCPAIEKRDKKVEINQALCVGCGMCEKKCAFGALGKAVN